jgi:hypothetical protein
MGMVFCGLSWNSGTHQGGPAQEACMTVYERLRFEIESNGGTYKSQPAVRDGKMAIPKTWQSQPDFYYEIFSGLEGN